MINFFERADPKYLGDDRLSDTEIQEGIAQIQEQIESFVAAQDVKSLLNLGLSFTNDDEWWDLDEIYRESIQTMEGYPFKEIFLTNTNSLIFSFLREDCYDAQLFPSSDSTPLLNEIIQELYSRKTELNVKIKDIENKYNENSYELSKKFPNYKKVSISYEKEENKRFQRRFLSQNNSENLDLIKIETAQQLNQLEAKIILEIIGEQLYETSIGLLRLLFSKLAQETDKTN